MVRCPWCGEDITKLDFREKNATISYIFYLAFGQPVYSDMQVLSCESEEYLCAKCMHTVALSEDGAVAFLKHGRLPEKELAFVVRKVCGTHTKEVLALLRNEQGMLLDDLRSYYFEGRHTLDLVRAWFSECLVPIELKYCPEPVLFVLTRFTEEDETFMRLVSTLRSVPEPLAHELRHLLMRDEYQAVLDKLTALVVEITLS